MLALPIPRDSTVSFWLGIMLSLAVLCTGLFLDFRRTKPKLGLVVFTVIILIAIVVVGDYLVGVWLACSHGDCI